MVTFKVCYYINLIPVISGLLTPIGKTSRKALISKEPTKFAVKICVISRCNRFYKKMIEKS
jgi:hypothetical protein